jgi:hypothetical protein
VINRREFTAAAALSISTSLAEAQGTALLTGSVGQIADLTIEFHIVVGVV